MFLEKRYIFNDIIKVIIKLLFFKKYRQFIKTALLAIKKFNLLILL